MPALLRCRICILEEVCPAKKIRVWSWEALDWRWKAKAEDCPIAKKVLNEKMA